MSFMSLGTRAAAALLLGAALLGCDERRIEKLEEGLSTEADVIAQFGPPESVWPEPDGSRTLEYPRQPAGHKNYLITIGTDGRMTALRQVLTPQVFARIIPGMRESQVRRTLGRPAKVMRYDLKQETHWDWQWIDPPSREMLFTVVFDDHGQVLRTMQSEPMRDGRR